MGMDLTAYNAVLKETYLPKIRENLNKTTVLMSRLEKTADFIESGGLYASMSLLLGYPQGIGARADGSPLPRAGQSKYVKSTIPIKTNYMRIQVSGKTIRASKTDKSAYAKAVDQEMKNSLPALKRDINRQMFNDGTGKLAQVNGAVTASTTVTVDNPGTVNLEADMYIDIYLTTTQEVDSVKIASVDSDTQITLEYAVTCTDNAYIYREDNYGSVEMMGLKGIIDDASYVETLQGISRTTYPQWKATSYDNAGTPRALALDLMQPPFSKVEKTGLLTLMLTSYGVRDKYVALLTADKRYVNTLKLDGGFEYVEYNGKPLVPDAQATMGTIYYVAESNLAIHRQSDFDWADEDGSVLSRISGYDEYEAFMYYDAELATDRCNSMAVLADLIE